MSQKKFFENVLVGQFLEYALLLISFIYINVETF